MRDPRASVVVLNYEGAAFLEECLESLEAQTFRDFELIVVDNASSDGSRSIIEAFARRTRLPFAPVFLPENLGFSAGNAAGRARARGGLLALLNNDARADALWLERLVRAADAHPEAGVFAAKMLVAASGVVDSAGVGFSTLLKGFNLGEGRPAALHGAPAEVFGACGGAVMYRQSMLDRIGFLDDDFFLIHEDVDLSFRAQLAGWKARYVPDAVVHHRVRSSIGKLSDLAVYHSVRNVEYVRLKNVPWGVALRLAPQIAAGQLAEFIYFALRHRRPLVYLAAKRDALRAVPRLLRQRAAVMRDRTLDDDGVRRLLTPALSGDFLKAKAAKLLFG